MRNGVYVLRLKDLERFFVENNITRSYENSREEEGSKRLAKRFCDAFVEDYLLDFERNNIVIYIEDGYVSYSGEDYYDDNSVDYDHLPYNYLVEYKTTNKTNY